MAQYKVAYVKEQGQQMIIVPLDQSFHYKTEADKRVFTAYLQGCATSAGLSGRVVPVWMYNNSMYFIAPQQWRPFFATLSWSRVMASLNMTLTCSEV